MGHEAEAGCLTRGLQVGCDLLKEGRPEPGGILAHRLLEQAHRRRGLAMEVFGSEDRPDLLGERAQFRSAPLLEQEEREVERDHGRVVAQVLPEEDPLHLPELRSAAAVSPMPAAILPVIHSRRTRTCGLPCLATVLRCERATSRACT
jgi:hypothetical protein